MASIFTKIISGEIPSFKIYENEYTYAFLSLDQINLGHTLVIPKIEVDHFTEVPEPYYSEVFKTAQLIGKAMLKATNCKRVGTAILGWDVPHFHYHIVPMFGVGDLDFRRARQPSKEDNVHIQTKLVEELKKL